MNRKEDVEMNRELESRANEQARAMTLWADWMEEQ